MGSRRVGEVGVKILATIFDNRYNKLYDVSEAIADSITIASFIEDQPNKCTFEIIKRDELAFWEGATIAIVVDGFKMFKGFVFSKQRKKDVDLITVTAYGQMRYLKNKDTYVFEGKTSDQIFSKICNDFVIPHRIVDRSNFICSPRSNDNKPLYDIIKTSLQDTLINTGQWFIIRDNFGVLEHVNVKSLVSEYVIGDQSALMDFDYTTSIDSDVYNQVKLYRDNKESGKRDIFIVNDTINGGQNLKEWGILQLYESVPENLNLKQIEQKAQGMLKLYNDTQRTLKLESMGIPSIQAGSIFACNIADLGDMSLNNYLMVNSCTHKISNNMHTMTLEVEVVV